MKGLAELVAEDRIYPEDARACERFAERVHESSIEIDDRGGTRITFRLTPDAPTQWISSANWGPGDLVAGLMLSLFDA